jgi:hypothetical protein
LATRIISALDAAQSAHAYEPAESEPEDAR